MAPSTFELDIWQGRLCLALPSVPTWLLCLGSARQQELQVRLAGLPWLRLLNTEQLCAALLARLPRPARLLDEHACLEQLQQQLNRRLPVVRLRKLLTRLRQDRERAPSSEPFPGWQPSELAALAARLVSAQEAAAAFDPVVARRYLQTQLDALSPDTLPARLILDQPAALRPSELELFAALARRLSVLCVVDPLLLAASRLPIAERRARPSLDAARLTCELLGRPGVEAQPLAETHPGGQPLVAALYDGGREGVLEAPGCDLWTPHDLGEEVALCVRLIKRGVVEGRWRAADVCLAVPELDRYLVAVRQALTDAGLACAIPAGEPLWALAPTACLRSLLDWQLQGSALAMLAYLGAYAGQLPRIDSTGLAAFEGEFGPLLTPEICDRLRHRLQGCACEALDPWRLELRAREASIFGGPDFERDWLCPFLDAGLWSDEDLLLDLAALWQRWEQGGALRQVAADLPGAVSLALEQLHADGCLQLRQAAAFDEPAAARLDAAQQLLIESLRAEARLAPAGGLHELRNAVERVVVRERLPGQSPVDAVRLLALDQTGQLFPEVLVCLGLTADLMRRVQSTSGNPAASARWLFARHLRQVPRLVLSAPRVVDNATQRPSTSVADMLRWLGSGRLHLGPLAPVPEARPAGLLPFAEPEQGSGFEPGLLRRAFDPGWTTTLQELAARFPDNHAVPGLLRTRADRGRQAICARAAAQLTPWDGALLPLTEPDASEGQVYAPRSLEVLVDCPHRYFFARRLRLSQMQEAAEDVSRPELGRLVHLCLERFWRERLRCGEAAISETNFDAACAQMLEIARETLAESGRDWNRNPVVAAEAAGLLAGLDQAGDTARRGPLKAALAFMRDHGQLHGEPWRLEWDLGGEPVPIARGVGLRLRIDRVDRVIEPDGSQQLVIIDYKTGRGASAHQWKTMRSLQLRLYALALQSWCNSAPEGSMLPLSGMRAGELVLGRSERRPGELDPQFFDPVRGVFREHLALAWFQKSWVIDPGACAGNLLRTREVVEDCDQRNRKGRLWQKLQPAACDWCEFRRICFHDPAALAAKLEHLPRDGRPAMFVTPPRCGPPEGRQVASALLRPTSPSPQPGGAEPELSTEQQQAARPELCATVSAGAGSGKTFVLKTRVLRLLRAGVPVSSLLAITFSEQAASEIRERIESALGSALESGQLDGRPLLERERGLLVRARAELAGAAFSTIHGFCQQLVAQAPILSGFEGVERVAWGPGLERLKTQAIEDLLYREPRAREPLLELLAEGVRLHFLRRELARFLVRPAELRSLERGLAREPAWWNKVFAKLQAHTGSGPQTAALDRKCLRLARLFVALASLCASSYAAAKQRARVADFEDLIEGAHRALVDEAPEALQPEQAALRARLRERFHHVLVDEFQDTDTRQWGIVRSLLEGRLPQGHGRPLEGGTTCESLDAPASRAWQGPLTCFLVGDPKQSIYGWRGGDHRVFLEASDYLREATGQPALELSDNYRSARAVVAFINGFFDPLFAADWQRSGQRPGSAAVPPQPMRPLRQAEGSVDVLFVPAEGDSEPLACAYLCANLLAGAGDPDLPRLDPAAPNPKIGVLCLTRRDMQAMSQALDAVGVPHVATHRSGFFGQAAIVAVETALRAVVDPRDPIALAGLLRGPCFGWSDRELQAARRQLGRDWWQELASLPTGKQVVAQLAAWRKLLPLLGPAAFVRRLIADVGLETAYVWAGRAEALPNLRRLLEMIEHAERNHALGSPLELPSWFAMQERAEEGAALAPSEHIPVVLMTVHGSKGLEFPVVLLPGLRSESRARYDFICSRLPGDREHSLAIRAGLAENSWQPQHGDLGTLLAQQVQAERNAELKRLFYVACTRARDHLVLVWTGNRQGREQERSLHEALCPHDLLRARLVADNAREPTRFYLEGSPLELRVLHHRRVSHPRPEAPRSAPQASLLATTGLVLQPPDQVAGLAALDLLAECPTRAFFNAQPLPPVAGALLEALRLQLLMPGAPLPEPEPEPLPTWLADAARAPLPEGSTCLAVGLPLQARIEGLELAAQLDVLWRDPAGGLWVGSWQDLGPCGLRGLALLTAAAGLGEVQGMLRLGRARAAMRPASEADTRARMRQLADLLRAGPSVALGQHSAGHCPACPLTGCPERALAPEEPAEPDAPPEGALPAAEHDG